MEVIELAGEYETEYAAGPVGSLTTAVMAEINGRDPAVSVQVTQIESDQFENALQDGVASQHETDEQLANWLREWSTGGN